MCVFFFVGAPTVVAKQYSDVTIKAALIFKFLRFIEWNNEPMEAQFVVGIYGNQGELFSKLDNSKPESIRNKAVVIERVDDLDDAKRVHILYVGNVSEEVLREIADNIRDTNTLLVTENSQSDQIVMINIISLPNNRISFEINKPNIVYEGLKISSKLLLHGGSELDVALLYRKMEQVLRRSTDQLLSAKNTLEAQNQLILRNKKQLVHLREEQSELKAEARKKEKILSNQQKYIFIKENLLQKNNLELEKKHKEIEVKSIFLKEKSDALIEKISALKEKDAELQSKTESIEKLAGDIRESTSILTEQREEVIRQHDLINFQKKTLTQHTTTIEAQKSILITVFGVFILISGLLVLLVRSYWSKQVALSATKEALAELEKTKTELEVTNAAIEKLSDAKSSFLSTLSHEVRNPINAIMGLTEVMLDDELKSIQRDRALNIYSSCDDLVPLLNGILNQSKKESKDLQFEDVDFNLRRTADNLVQTQFYDSNLSKVKTNITITSDVPDRLHGDVLSFKRVLINLLSNARKFTHQGVVSVLINVGRSQEEFHWLNVAVKDTGEGISEVDMPELFKEYSQTASGLADGVVGTGLGLSLSRRIVEKFGGTLNCESVLGVGTTFSFTFPFQESTMEIPVHEHEVGVVDRKLRPLNILVVDDVPVNCRVCEELLAPHGHRVFSAFDGVEGIEQATNITDLDVILMDIKMPLMDGVEAAKIIKEKKPDVYIIALTANDNEKDKVEYLAAGMADVVTKPISGRALRQTLLSLYNATDDENVDDSIAVGGHEKKEGENILNDRFNDLVDELGVETICAMIPELIQSLEGMVQDLLSAIEAGNKELIVKLIHKTKGTSVLWSRNLATV